jgi:predicted TIM-barrel fold metal-dependent hydrolase
MKGQFHVIDANRHVMEPPDLWDTWLEQRYRGQVAVNGDGTSIVVKGRAVSDPRPSYLEVPSYKRLFGDALTAGFDASSHLRDMDKEGVDVGVLLPTKGMYVIWADHIDTDLSAALCRAYNNWLHSYCAADPRRLKGVALVPLQGAEEARVELRRAVQELGFAAVYMRPNPLLKRKLHDRAYDPLYEEAESLGIPIVLHEGWGSVLHQLGEDRQDTIFGLEGVLDPFEMMLAFLSFMGHNVLERFPGLRVGYIGAGIGWVPYWLDRVDEHWGGFFGTDAPSMQAPSLLFKTRGFAAADPWEKSLPEVIEECGQRTVVWGSQYPLPEAAPFFPNELDTIVNDGLLTESQKKAVLWDNAAELFHIS